MGINHVIIQGNLGQDPELRYSQNQTPVVMLSVATNESWVKDGEKHEKTEWHRVVAWRKTAENCAKYLVKGQQCTVIGRLETRKWQDKQGVDRYTTEIVADKVEFGSKSGGGDTRAPHPADSAPEPAGGGQQQRAQANTSAQFDGATPSLDDIPF